ncbi:hypothetical protein F442_05288 [Phytophthora nicotianae P10297]|uniref:Uncharacterized protein n=2 Tax=Phytophthora nicotianae TaxID=4792 RepID=W2ZNX5_PHYNI|nr:hypothetical protein F444_05281 [Phytophthora nicotianae P1976]ETP49102.1 hypothetical protein F442_05288 [Phytophthora nicotianae P10297]
MPTASLKTNSRRACVTSVGAVPNKSSDKATGFGQRRPVTCKAGQLVVPAIPSRRQLQGVTRQLQPNGDLKSLVRPTQPGTTDPQTRWALALSPTKHIRLHTLVLQHPSINSSFSSSLFQQWLLASW